MISVIILLGYIKLVPEFNNIFNICSTVGRLNCDIPLILLHIVFLSHSKTLSSFFWSPAISSEIRFLELILMLYGCVMYVLLRKF